MELRCPKCQGMLDLANAPETLVQCPDCAEEIDLGRLHEQTCPVCCSSFGDDDSLVVCPNCKTFYHVECWEENHGCSTYGCASTQHLEVHNQPPSDGGESPVVDDTPKCPFCGSPCSASDVVCSSCGHLLNETGMNDDLFESSKRIAVACWPNLKRNFVLLWIDVRSFVSLGFKSFVHYADFRGKTTRRECLSFLFAFFALMMLALAFKAELFLYWVVFPAYFLPVVSTIVRRLRDTGLSPWMILALPILPLLILVPSVNEQSQSKENS